VILTSKWKIIFCQHADKYNFSINFGSFCEAVFLLKTMLDVARLTTKLLL